MIEQDSLARGEQVCGLESESESERVSEWIGGAETGTATEREQERNIAEEQLHT